MRVTVKLFAGFRAGRFIAEVFDFQSGMTVDQVVQEQEIPYVEVGILLCNGRHVELEHELQDSDILSIFPKVGGG